MVESLLEAGLRRDRSLVVAGLTGVVVLAWAYILAGAGMSMTAFEMTAMAEGDAPVAATAKGMAMQAMTPAAWSPGYALLMLVMWWVMMVAMMLPSAAPMILLFTRVERRRVGGEATGRNTAIFAAGYLLAWGAYSLAATALQWGLEAGGLLSAMLRSSSLWLGGVLLVAAGLWQFTPWKDACLTHCRNPLSNLAHHWRPGRAGALRMGLAHGSYCLGCCWFLMALLFYGGVMNLYWIAGLALFVLVEKTLRRGAWLRRAAGGLLVVWGLAVLAAAV